MKLRHLFAINCIIAVFFGLACSLFPRWVFQFYGAAYDAAAIWSARLAGGSILGFATLMWFGARAATVEARRAIALALLVQDGIGFIASLEIQGTGSVNALGWSNPVLYALLALAYAFFIFVRPKDA
jgi:hypothetical protein